MVDYQGNVLGLSRGGANSFCAGIVDIEALRNFRTMNLNSNWMKDLRTEVFRHLYDAPIHPANLWLQQEPLQHAAVDEVYRANIERLIERGCVDGAGAPPRGVSLHRAVVGPGRGRVGRRQGPLGGGSGGLSA